MHLFIVFMHWRHLALKIFSLKYIQGNITDAARPTIWLYMLCRRYSIWIRSICLMYNYRVYNNLFWIFLYKWSTLLQSMEIIYMVGRARQLYLPSISYSYINMKTEKLHWSLFYSYIYIYIHICIVYTPQWMCMPLKPG